MNRNSRILWLLLVVLLTLPALWPLLSGGPFVSSVDARFHVYRIAALADAWQHGVLAPRSLPQFGFGYGQAVLNYYAPLAYWPGALLASLGVSPEAALGGVIALGFILAALAAFGFGRYLWGPWGGLLAALAYTYFPYHLVDAYVRGAIPEHFAFIWPPLILWASAAAFREPKSVAPCLWGALAWAGLILTHNLTALIMAPVWIVFVVAMALWTRKWRRLAAAAGSLGLAVLLSAPLWLPFLAESRYVGLSLPPGEGYREHLAPLNDLVQRTFFYHYKLPHVPEGGADYPLSLLNVTLAAAVLALTVWRWAAGRAARRSVGETLPAAGPLIFSMFLAAGAVVMTAAPALPIWQALPAIASLQYPWRFLGMAALGLAGLTAALPALLAGRGSPAPAAAWPVPVICATAAIALLLVLQPLPTIPREIALSIPAAEALSPDRMWREDADAGQVGATWTGEFLPLAVSEQRWALGRPREGAADGPALSPRPAVQVARVGYDSIELVVNTGAPFAVRLHQFYLPAWQARVNGDRVPTSPAGELALVSAKAPAGESRVAFRFGPTPAWLAGRALALLGVVIWVVLAWRHPAPGLRAAVVGLAAIALALGLNSLGVGKQTWTPTPVSAAVGDAALLVGYDAAQPRTAAGTDVLDVTLYWFALRDVGANYKAFVHLLGPDGQVLAQHDGDPGGGYTPTSRWRAGEISADTHRLPLPSDLAPGVYRLKAGLYQPDPFANLPVDPPTADGRVDLGEAVIR